MTVSYQYKVASSTSGGFTRLLFLWRGSLYKLIYRELLIFLIAFDILSILYRNMLTDHQKIIFEEVVKYCDEFISMIPLTFILGFYVAYVASRWWQQYEAIPWPDKCMHTIALYITGNNSHTRMIRRTLMRYLNLTLVLILRSISSAVKKRFPTLDHLTEVGFMTQAEKQMFLAIPNTDFNTYWVPCAWFVHTLKDAKAENANLDPMGVKLIMEEFNEFRGKCGMLWSYDWISIPLVYTQVVTLATYSFFFVATVARQYVEHSDKKMQMKIDIYLPVFTILQFFFFMGLLKVAEQLINPFGDDDEDFELNWLIDRHTKVSYLGVDTLMLQRPPLTKDKFFDNSDLILPYTEAAAIHKKKTYRGSVHNMMVPEEQQELYLPEIIEEENEENDTSVRNRRPSIFVNPFAKSSENESEANYPKTRRKSMFNFFEKRVSMERTPDVARFKADNLSGNGGIYNSSIERTSSDKKITPRRGASMMAPSGNMRTRWSSIRQKRRRSVPNFDLQKEECRVSGIRRDSSVLSNRRDSVMDGEWKGIRWKPYVADEQQHQQQIDSLNVTGCESGEREGTTNHTTTDLDTTLSYVNRAFRNSTTEEGDVISLRENIGGDEDRRNENLRIDQNQGLAVRSVRRGSRGFSANVVLNLPLDDSLV